MRKGYNSCKGCVKLDLGLLVGGNLKGQLYTNGGMGKEPKPPLYTSDKLIII